MSASASSDASRIATIMLADGVDDPDGLIPVVAGELFEWAWLAAELADWLDQAGPATRAEFTRHFDHLRSPGKVAVFLAQISERIAALLDGDRGQP
ncbi:hypothetical protein [Prauserella muralis]|uniref:Uncharacterized protein n=1 Tax=Prauserella muralis TaxID=588067 RepID=A0A2V4B2I8_9PSEU|nr:hypothetical protein [Prauserella muralis]PXY28491.1 hypothetical protein BAY60_18335 [Prauserella muralis]TWE27449.1 hypothetical protein FHX69_0080 [Prauserella muralis]